MCQAEYSTNLVRAHYSCRVDFHVLSARLKVRWEGDNDQITTLLHSRGRGMGGTKPKSGTKQQEMRINYFMAPLRWVGLHCRTELCVFLFYYIIPALATATTPSCVRHPPLNLLLARLYY